MKWPFIPLVAVLSLAATAPAPAAPDTRSGQPLARQNDQQLAQNDHRRDHDNRHGHGGPQYQRHHQQRFEHRRETERHRPPAQHYRRETERHRPPAQHYRRETERHRPPAQHYRRETERHYPPTQHRRYEAERHHPRYNWHHYQPGRRPPEWERHRHFDRRAWEHNQRAERRYYGHRYHRPHGWYHRRWTYGMILPRLFWPRQYWITSYWQFGLPNPPYGYVWVRYSDDALLVDVSTGRILRVVYGLFY